MSQAVLDRLEIADLLGRYANALDDRDWDRLARCFTADAVGEYGTIGHFDGFAAIDALCRRTLEPLDTSQHLVGSIEIELAGDAARAQCAFQAQHTKRGCDGGENYTVAGTYRDHLVRTADGWRIAHRQLQVSWTDGNPRVMAAS